MKSKTLKIIYLLSFLLIAATNTVKAQYEDNIGGYVFLDSDCDGIKDAGESGIAPSSTWYVYLLEDLGSGYEVIEVTTVSSSGIYTFSSYPTTWGGSIPTFKLVLSSTSYSVGTFLSSMTSSPPFGYKTGGESIGTTNDGTADGQITSNSVTFPHNFGLCVPSAFSCSATGYIFNSTVGNPRGNGSATQVIYPVTIVAGESVIGSSLYTSDLETAATAYNSSDNFMYGVSVESGNTAPFHYLKFGTDFGVDMGTISSLPTSYGINPSGINAPRPYNCAAFNNATGTMYVAAWGNLTNADAVGTVATNRVIYPITIVSGVPTAGTPITITGTIVNNGTTCNIADFTYINGYIYAIGINSTTSVNSYYRIDLSTGISTTVQTYGTGQPGGTALQSGNNQFNSSFLDDLGQLSLYQGNSSFSPAGRVVRMNPITGMYIDDTRLLSSSTNADGASCAYSATAVTLSGTVFNDNDAAFTPSGTPINGVSVLGGTDTLWVNLLGPDGLVIGTTYVKADGTYEFTNMVGGRYHVQINETKGTLGATPPAINLHGDFEHVSSRESPPTPLDGEIDVFLSTTNVSNVDFGINQPPVADTLSITAMINPGGTSSAPIPSSSFGGTDPNSGSIASLTITSFPTNATSFSVGTVTYYPTGVALPGVCPTASCLSFPASGGVTVATNAAGEPSSAITIDPLDGALIVRIPYVVTDNAGLVSAVPGYVDIPFTVSLPLKLLSFEAQKQDSKVKVIWNVADEKSIATYSVMRSKNGTDWQAIDKLNALNNSQSTSQYISYDKQPYQGLNFYRLLIAELDGTYSYSPTRVVQVSNPQQGNILVYPNPAIEQLQIVLGANSQTNTYELIDAVGRIMLKGNLTAGTKNTIDISPIVSGIYMLKIITDGEAYNQQIQILR